MLRNRRGNPLAAFGGRLFCSREKALSARGGPRSLRSFGTLERLEPRMLLSAGYGVDSPIAGDDFYSTPAGTTLQVSAPGVLANDYDPGGERLEALYLLQYAELRYGTLLMPDTNGSFTYIPRAGENGQETFTYFCMDRSGYYEEVTVTIDVGVFNHAPSVANPMADVHGSQGDPDIVIDLDTVFDDVDIPRGDQLNYSVTVSPPILPIVNQVSQSSYEHLHGDLLYTHLGDSRGYGSTQHDLARDNIYDHFQGLGLTTSLDVITDVEDVVGNKYQFNPPLVNVVGVKTGVTYPDNIYIVGAHYDSVGNPGADDNASGVAAVMEIARVLAPYSFDSTLHFVAFDGEEDGLWGSMHYAEFHTPGQVLGMVSVDMIGFNQTGQGHDVVSIFDSDNQGPIKSSLVAAFADYGGGLVGENAGALDASDHAPFEWFGYDSALVIESAMANEPFANLHYHQSTDAVETPSYFDYNYATKITGAVTGYLAQSAGVLGTVDVLGASVTGGLLTVDYDPTKSGGAVITVRATDVDGLFIEDSFSVTLDELVGAASVVGRHVFYNNSSFDGNDPAANAFDDAAIATDKTALLPGQTATFANYTSYSHGINGIMVDIHGLADPAAVEDADLSEFSFMLGNDDTPGDWEVAADPREIKVRDLGSGVSRVTFTWDAGAIPTRNWLQVTVKQDPATGLAADDIFYFGSSAGETTGDLIVNYDDLLGVIWPVMFTAAQIDSPADINRDGVINYDDILDPNAWWDNIFNLTPLTAITPAVPPPPTTFDAVFSDDLSWAAEVVWFDELYGAFDDADEEELLQDDAADDDFAFYSEE